jgi:hypothetical protein
MAVAHITVLELLGKEVSFVYFVQSNSRVFSLPYSGTVNAVVVNLSSENEFFVDDIGPFTLSKVENFKIF